MTFLLGWWTKVKCGCYFNIIERKKLILKQKTSSVTFYKSLFYIFFSRSHFTRKHFWVTEKMFNPQILCRQQLKTLKIINFKKVLNTPLDYLNWQKNINIIDRKINNYFPQNSVLRNFASLFKYYSTTKLKTEIIPLQCN